MFLQFGLACFVVFMTCFNAAANPLDNEEATVDEEPVVGPRPQIYESFVDNEENHRRLVRETCDSKWTNIDPQHTMCLNDVGVEVVLDDATKAALLKQHNDLRSQVVPLAADMTKMVWDEELALVAAKWARQCVVGHDPGTARLVPSLPRVNVGQNAAFGFSTFEEGIQSWFDENNNFLYGNGTTGGVVGHYTQVVAARSQRVGCGQAYCSGYKYEKYYVCNYAYGQMTEDTKKPYTSSSVSCSACPTKCDASGKLCDCEGKVCLNGGTFNIATCSCSCSSPFTGDICQTLNCPKSDSRYCNTQYLPPSYCKIFSNVPSMCPYMCGICTASGQ